MRLNNKKNILTLRNGGKLLKHEKTISNQQRVTFQMANLLNHFN